MADNKPHMTRLHAERIVAAASRIPTGDKLPDPAADAPPKRRTLSRILSRGPSATLNATNELYLQQAGVRFFVEDLMRQLAENRPDQADAFIASYFAAVTRGTNVKGREFEYIHGCVQNRAAFLTQLQRSYAKTDPVLQLTGGDFAELLECQCRDVPRELLDKAWCHLPVGDDGQIRATLRAFLAAFGVCFFYYEFVSKVGEVYADLQATKDSRVSSPSVSMRSESIASAMAADRVVARFRVIAQQSSFPVPPIAELEPLVCRAATFPEFCGLLYQAVSVTDSIASIQAAFLRLAE